MSLKDKQLAAVEKAKELLSEVVHLGVEKLKETQEDGLEFYHTVEALKSLNRLHAEISKH